MRLLGGENEMAPEDDPAVPAAQAHVPTFDHTSRTLSGREMGILRCLMQGESNKIIARQFDITEATVKAHIKAILRKICVRNRTQAAVWAHNHLLDLANTVHGRAAIWDWERFPFTMSEIAAWNWHSSFAGPVLCVGPPRQL
jgi:DNA-binding CsgD family transcriptional regulator